MAVADAATVDEDGGTRDIAVLANDTDADGGSKSIASVTQPANGTVQITGGGTGLTYEPDPDYCNDPPGTSTDDFSYTLAPGGSSAPVAITVTCLGDPPVVTTSGLALDYTENDPATAIDTGLTVSDGDDTQLEGATVTVSGGFQSGDELLFTDSPPIMGSGSGTGVLTLTGTASVAAYEAALRSVEFRHTGDDPALVKTVEFRADDGDGVGPASTRNIAMTPVDDAPVAVDDSHTVDEGADPSAIEVPANDTDVDGGPKTIASASDPANGTVVLTGGSPGAHTGLTYQPDPNYCNDPPGTTPDTFTYTLNGGSTATVSISVTCVDNAPTAVDDNATVGEDSGAGAIDVLANDTDTDGGPKTISSASDPANGTVVLTGGSTGAHTGLIYQPDPGYCNDPPGTTPDTFMYTLNGGSAATVSVTVTCVDDAPLAVNDSATVAEDSPAPAIAALANDLNVDGGPMTIASASDPANGTVVLTGGSPAAHTGLTYQPDPNYCNSHALGTPDTFTYTLNGGSTATVSVTVTCAPDNPVVDSSAGATSYTENGPGSPIDSAVTVSDPDAGGTIAGATVQITGGYAGAEDVLALASPGSHPDITPSFAGDTLTLTGDASAAAYQAALRDVTYRNSSDSPSTAARTVTFSVTDETALIGSDSKGLTVTAVDDPPVAVDDSATVLEDAAATAVPVLSNDTDIDAGPETITSATDPTNGTVVLTGGSPGAHTGLTYQPDPNYCNSPPGTTLDTFNYSLNGGDSGTVSITVTCVNDAPVADDETFNGANSAVGNTTLVVNDPDDGAPATPDPTDTSPVTNRPHKTISGDILAGDTDVDGPGPLTVTAGTFATNDGGSVTVEADGDFTFEPAAAASCTDTSDFFDYTVEDSGLPELTDTGRVTIAITGCVWYVNNDDAQGNSGTSSQPFDTLAQAETASAAGHTIFVYDGNNTTSGYAAGFNLKANQRLIGEAAALIVGSDTLHAADSSNKPTLTDPNADVVDLDDANEVRGLSIDPQGTGGGIAGTTGDTGGGTIDDVNIVDTGTAGTQPGLELDATTGTFNISNLTVNTNGATGVRLNNAGTVNFLSAGTISITSTGAPGLSATGALTSMGTSTFDSITVTGSGSGGVDMTNTTGTTTFGDLALTTTSGATPAFGLSNAGTVSVPAAGTANVSATGGPAVDVTGTSGAALAFDAVSSTNSANDGINLAGLGTGTFSAANGTITGAAGISFDLDGGSGAVTYPGGLNNGAGASAEITGRSGGAVTLSGAIADSNDAGGGISLSGNTGGTTTFSNASKVLNTTTSPAVSFAGSDGHTLTLSGGGLDIDTTTGTGIDATNSGTLVVGGASNAIDSISGTALNVANTDIGAGGAAFQRVSSGNATAAADPASGIVLNNTGATAGLAITGLGSTAQGGDNSGGTIQNTTGHGISLTSTTSPSLRNMQLLNTGDSGVNGTQVSGFSFVDGTITGAGDASDENSITFDDSLTGSNLSGVVTVTNNVISQTEASGVEIENGAGTISDANISGNALSDTGDIATPGSAVLLVGRGSAATTAQLTKATLSNNVISNFNAGAGFVVQANNVAGGPATTMGIAGSATNKVLVNNNRMAGGNLGVGNQPDRFITSGINGSGQANVEVTNNGTAADRIRNIDCIAIELQADGPATMTSTVQNNFINPNSAVGCAGIAVGTDDPQDRGAGTHSTLISGNNVMGTDGQGIFAIVRDSASTMNARVLNNTVAAPIANVARSGIQASSGSAAGDTTLCLEISGNTTAGSTNTDTGTTSPGIALRKQGTDPAVNTFGIEGMAATASPGVENYVNGLNTSASGTFGVGGTTLLSAQSGFTNCNAP